MSTVISTVHSMPLDALARRTGHVAASAGAEPRARLASRIAAFRSMPKAGMEPSPGIGAVVEGILSQVAMTTLGLCFWPSQSGGLAELLNHRVPIAGDKLPTEVAAGFELTAMHGERARLLLPDLFAAPVATLHLLFSVHQSSGGESPVSLRWLRGDDPEETIVGFHGDQWILNTQVAFFAEPQPHLLSATCNGEELRIFVDGTLAFWRPTRRSGVPDGISLDVIGAAERPACMIVHGMVAESAPVNIAFDSEAGPSAAVNDALRARNIPAIARLLHAFALAPLRLDQKELIATLDDLRAQPLGYPKHVVDGLLGHTQPVPAQVLPPNKRSAPQPVIRLEKVSVSIPANPAGSVSFKRLLRRHRHQMLRLLDGIEVSIYPGDIVGVIGRNGAGKSTLLRTIIGAMPISAGRIGVRGKPTLLRPGGGMQGELTGLQNIMRAGLYMGLLPSKIRQIADDVIEFSELGEHIHRPFRYYSDGMRSRLIFALATCVPHDILMLDELLSAGDLYFQQKAMKRLDEFISTANTVIVVQHTFDFILTKCNKCLYLKQGQQEFFGDPSIATELYKGEL